MEFSFFRNVREGIYKEEMDPEIINEMDQISSITTEQLSDCGIILQSLENTYQGYDKLKILSFAVQKGTCAGIICLNSKIRTSIFNMIVGDEKIASGDIFLNGKSHKNKFVPIMDSFGFCSEECGIMKNMTGRENLKTIGTIKGIPSNLLNEKIEKLANDLNFYDVLEKYVKGYSEMNRKLLGLAIALISDPQTIVLEEPTLDLDAIMIKKLSKIIDALKTEGKTVLILSNNLIPLDSVLDKITIVANGEMKFLNSYEVFKIKYFNGVNIVIELKADDSENLKLSKKIEIKNFIFSAFNDTKIR